MPSSDEGSISRWSQFLGRRDVSTPKRPSSLDVHSIDTAIHVDPGSPGQERPGIRSGQPKWSLRRKKGRIFDKGVLGVFRKLSGNKSPSSSSDPEDAPNRPHIVPPLHDSSDPERSSLRQRNDVDRGSAALLEWSRATGSAVGALVDPGYALTSQEKLSEITELLQVRTGSAGVTLQRLAELDCEIDGQERQGLLTIAKSAANVASREYSRVRRTRPKAPLARMLERNAEVPLAGVNDYREYLRCLQLQAKELRNGAQGFGRLREAIRGVENVQRSLAEASDMVKREDSAAEMAEIQWWVERKCMFWAAVDILTTNNVQVEQAGDMDC